MRALDTNVLIRLIVRDDPEQVARAESFVSLGAFVPLLVLVEAVWVLRSVYGVDREGVHTAVGMLLEHDRLVLEDQEVVRRALATFGENRAPGFADCLIIETTRKAGHGPVGTFDRRMSRMPGTEAL